MSNQEENKNTPQTPDIIETGTTSPITFDQTTPTGIDSSDENTDHPKLIKRRRKGYAAPLGLIVIILTIIGFISVVMGGTKLFYVISNNQGEKDKYATMLNPLVMLDIPDFDNPSKINPSNVLQTCLWTLLSSGDISTYKTDDQGRTLIPIADLDVVCAKLYGDQTKIIRQSMTADGEMVTDTNTSDYSTVVFLYDTKSESFAIPAMGEFGNFYASVTKIQKDGNYKYITVAYHPLQSNATGIGSTSGEVITKYKQYVLKKATKGNNYTIVALRDSDVPGENN